MRFQFVGALVLIHLKYLNFEKVAYSILSAIWFCLFDRIRRTTWIVLSCWISFHSAVPDFVIFLAFNATLISITLLHALLKFLLPYQSAVSMFPILLSILLPYFLLLLLLHNK